MFVQDPEDSSSQWPTGSKANVWEALLQSLPTEYMHWAGSALELQFGPTPVLLDKELFESVVFSLAWEGMAAREAAAAAKQAARLAKERSGAQGAVAASGGTGASSSTTGGGSSAGGGGSREGPGAEVSVCSRDGLAARIQKLLLEHFQESASAAVAAGDAAASAAGGGAEGWASSTRHQQQHQQQQDGVAAASSAAAASAAELDLSAIALLVACRAAGALGGLPGLLGKLGPVITAACEGDTYGLMAVRGSTCNIEHLQHKVKGLAVWAVKLQPLLCKLLPPEHAAVVEAGAGRGAEALGEEEVKDVLAALAHVHTPLQPGCHNPLCSNLEGPSEAELPTQACSGCKGVFFCCKECQKDAWKAHSAACKAAMAAAAKAVEEAAAGAVGMDTCVARDQKA
jgi:hypothetical protein